MRERAEQIGGSLAVSSTPESGTEIAFSLPGARAYERAERKKASWLGRLFRES
jgi:signal transduction histidine kinase